MCSLNSSCSAYLQLAYHSGGWSRTRSCRSSGTNQSLTYRRGAGDRQVALKSWSHGTRTIVETFLLGTSFGMTVEVPFGAVPEPGQACARIFVLNPKFRTGR